MTKIDGHIADGHGCLADIQIRQMLDRIPAPMQIFIGQLCRSRAGLEHAHSFKKMAVEQKILKYSPTICPKCHFPNGSITMEMYQIKQ